jgi:L-aspartate oxidase
VPGPLASGSPASAPPPQLSQASRDALWRDAGLERDRDGLRGLINDPNPLVRLVAQCALARTESRGAHRRRDFPVLDHELDRRHMVVGADGEPTLALWE